MLSWFTLAFILLLFTAIPLEANSNQNECGDLNLTIPFSPSTTAKGSGSSLYNNGFDVLWSSTYLEERVQGSSFTKVAKVRLNNSTYRYSNCSFYTGAGAKMLLSDKVYTAMNLIDHTTSPNCANNFTTVICSCGLINYEPLTLRINSLLADQEDMNCSGIGCCHFSIPRGINYSFVFQNFQNCSKQSVHSLIEVGTQQSLPHSKVFHANYTYQKLAGLGFCCLFIVFGITGIYSSVKNQKLVKHKSKFFKKNGGLLLQQHINASTTKGHTTIFTSKELDMTMIYYKKSHSFGPEDYGVQRFVDEIITLTQINHQNVVKLLGCCLETEAPILVYELASNGTLFDYIHHRNGRSSLPWDTLLKIASESAAGLAYLHSASIIHGNVKSSNILLTDCFMAKVVGFEPSRLVPSNESQMSTLFQRTLGYLDPEYLHKVQLTDKSDVYSFGMVLLEIVTGEKPVSFGRPENQRIISSHFVFFFFRWPAFSSHRI